MDAPLLIVVGTSLLFVVALVVFVVVLVRSVRASRRAAWDSGYSATGAASTDARPIDASLDGLEVEVAQDAPSASLLTPLRTGEWHPPAEPAPLEGLEAAALAGRIADFEPAPDVKDPPFSVEHYAAWHVDGSAQTPTVPFRAHAESSDDTEDAALDAEIAALLPQPLPARIPDEPHPAITVAVEPASEQDTPAPVESWTPPVLEPAPVPASEPEPVPELRPTPVSEQPTAVETEFEQTWGVEPVTPTEPESQPLPAAQAEDESLEEAVIWAGMLAEQAGTAARAVAPAPPVTPRPEVRIAAPEPVAVQPLPQPEPEPAPVRPRVRVHVASAEHAEPAGARALGGVAPVGGAALQDRRLINPRLEMAAPVEMWFGEARVGVKAGTATYDRFRKYADALLTELRDSQSLPR